MWQLKALLKLKHTIRILLLRHWVPVLHWIAYDHFRLWKRHFKKVDGKFCVQLSLFYFHWAWLQNLPFILPPSRFWRGSSESVFSKELFHSSQFLTPNWQNHLHSFSSWERAFCAKSFSLPLPHLTPWKGYTDRTLNGRKLSKPRVYHHSGWYVKNLIHYRSHRDRRTTNASYKPELQMSPCQIPYGPNTIQKTL